MNKKWIWVVAVVVVLGIVVAYFATGGFKSKEGKLVDDLVNSTEGTDKYMGLAKSVDVVYDVLKGEAELKYTIDEGLLEQGMLKMDVSFANKSQKLLKMVEIKLQLIDGSTVLFEHSLGFVDIKPGVTRESTFGPTDLTKLDGKAKKITLTLRKASEGTTVSPTPTPSATISLAKGSPGEVVAAFFEAIKEGRYTDAKEQLSVQSRIDYLAYLNEYDKKNYSSLEEALKARPENERPQKIEVVGEPVIDDAAKATVKCKIYLPSETRTWSFNLVKENGAWKLVMP